MPGTSGEAQLVSEIGDPGGLKASAGMGHFAAPGKSFSLYGLHPRESAGSQLSVSSQSNMSSAMDRI